MEPNDPATDDPSTAEARPSVDAEISGKALMGRLRDGNGRFDVHGTPDVLGMWVAAGRQARRLGLVPDGFHLETSRRYFGLLFRLLPGAHPMSRRHHEGRTVIPVPERLTRPHKAVSALRSEKRISVSKSAQPRALLLAQGLCAEAERRGHGVAVGKEDHDLVITVNGYGYGIKIGEQYDRVPHQPTATELREKERHPWTRLPEFNAVPTRRLIFEVDDAWNGRQRRWADGKRQRVDDRLWDLLNEIEQRAVEAEQKRIEAERKKQERQLRWERAMVSARERYVQHGLALELRNQTGRLGILTPP